MWKDKLKRNIKEILFGLYLIVVLSISVAASAQNGVQYGTMMFFSLTIVSVCLIVPKVSAKIRAANCKTYVPEKKINSPFVCIFASLFYFLSFLVRCVFPGCVLP